MMCAVGVGIFLTPTFFLFRFFYIDCPISVFPKAIRQRETKSLGKR